MIDDLISVIIPVYNVEDYLEECLDSVLNQTYKEIEVIVVNDGSTDNSLEILKEYKDRYSNIKIINQENSGQSVARNKGLAIAKGKYIYFLDSDDFIKIDTFQSLMEVFNVTEVDLIRFSADSFLDNINMKLDEDKYKFNKYFSENKIYEKEEFLTISTKAFTASPVLYIMKRSILFENNIKFFPGIIHEDNLFTVELFLNTNKAIYIPKSFYKRRYRKGSTMTTNTIQQKKNSFKSRCIILEELCKLSKKYTEVSEVALIKKRIEKTIELLARKYPEISNRSKVNQIRKMKLPYGVFYYYYHYIRGIIINLVRQKKV